jgi:heme-degrading monooxygenase HmoA
MSHFSRIKTSIREIDLLKKSLTNLNLVWEEKEQLIEGYQGETHKVNLVLPQENNIDIGFERTQDNSYQLVADLSFWDQSTSVDAFLDSLHKEYALTTVLEETKKQGFEKISQTQNQQNGEVVVIVEKWNS